MFELAEVPEPPKEPWLKPVWILAAVVGAGSTLYLAGWKTKELFYSEVKQSKVEIEAGTAEALRLQGDRITRVNEARVREGQELRAAQADLRKEFLESVKQVNDKLAAQDGKIERTGGKVEDIYQLLLNKFPPKVSMIGGSQ